MQPHQQASRRKPAPRGYISLNDHSKQRRGPSTKGAKASIASNSHHCELSGFTRELGLLPSCKRRRTACEQAYQLSRDTDAAAPPDPATPADFFCDRHDAQQQTQDEAIPSVSLHAAPGSGKFNNGITNNVAGHDLPRHALPGGEPAQASIVHISDRNDAEAFEKLDRKGSDHGSQHGSDTSSTVKLHINVPVTSRREQRAKQRELNQHTNHHLKEAVQHMQPQQHPGRISKRKGIPHRSAY